MQFENLFSIRGKVALVTGGSRGIGEMIAAGFLANGVKVYISSRKAAACDATATRLSETFGGECISLPADVADVAFLAERLVLYKVPRSFEIVDDALRDDAGKVRRSALRAARISG